MTTSGSMDAAIAAVRLLEGTPLAQVLVRFGHVLQARGIGRQVVEGCPFAACRAKPFGVVPEMDIIDGVLTITESAGRPRVSVYGDAWHCWACGAMGGPEQWAAAQLGIWNDPNDVAGADALSPQGPQVPPQPLAPTVAEEPAARLHRVALGLFRSNRDPERALALATTWASRNASNLDPDIIDTTSAEAARAALENGSHP